MVRRRTARVDRPVPPTPPDTPRVGKRELILMAHSAVGLRVTSLGIAAGQGGNVRGLEEVIRTEGVTIEPLFGLSEDRIRARLAALPEATHISDLGTFYHVKAPDERLDELAASLRKLDEVAAAYVKPAGQPPVAVASLNAMAP